MKIQFASNGWTPIISGLDLAKITQDQAYILGCIVGTQTLAVIKNQPHLTIDQEVDFLKMLGTVDVDGPRVKNVVVDESNRMLRRVTGKKRDDNSSMGLFESKEILPWHANPVEDPDRKSVVYLRGVSGTNGSITSFTNHARAWNVSLPSFVKDYLIEQNLHTLHEHDHTNDIATETMMNLFGTTHRPSMYSQDQLPTLLYQNKFGTKGLYLSWLQFSKFRELEHEESAKIKDLLRFFIMNDQNNIYDHTWTDGDVVLSDQWLGLHKRHAFEQIEDRLLHRGVVEYSDESVNFLNDALSLLK